MTVESQGRDNAGGGAGGIASAKETFQVGPRVPIIFCPPGRAGAAMSILRMLRRAEGDRPSFPKARVIFHLLTERGFRQGRKT
jgi:hypothetical protein